MPVRSRADELFVKKVGGSLGVEVAVKEEKNESSEDSDDKNLRLSHLNCRDDNNFKEKMKTK